MGSSNCNKSPATVLNEAIEGGISFFQFREKGYGALVGEEKLALAKQLQQICRNHNIPFIVNDDVELAIQINADGVHIGQEDGSIAEVKKKIGDKILGVSVHSYQEAITAIQEGADYFGTGPIFPTKTKEDTQSSQGTKLIELLRHEGVQTPIVGIGGINQLNASTVIRAGADGVSVISAISLADSPLEAARALKKSVMEGRK
jgi:thiamine-phosphate pyrophosphorylase